MNSLIVLTQHIVNGTSVIIPVSVTLSIPEKIDNTAYFYLYSTMAQSAAAVAGLIGALIGPPLIKMLQEKDFSNETNKIRLAIQKMLLGMKSAVFWVACKHGLTLPSNA